MHSKSAGAVPGHALRVVIIAVGVVAACSDTRSDPGAADTRAGDASSCHRDAHLELRESVIARTWPIAEGSDGIGLGVHKGGQAALRDTVLQGNRMIGAVSFGGSTLTLDRVAVRDPEPRPPGSRIGIAVAQGGRLRGRSVEVTGS